MIRHSSVLAAVDFSPDSRRALSEAVRICKTLDRPLHVIHVVDRRVVEDLADLLDRPLGQTRQRTLVKARNALQRWIEEADAPPDTRLHLAVGVPVAEILSCVEAVEPGLLVLGERGLSHPRVSSEPLGSLGSGGASTRVLIVDEWAHDERPAPA